MPLEKPLFIYDGECGFCRKWVARLRSICGDRLDYKAFQDCAHDYPQISASSFQKSVYIIQPNGTYHAAAQAVFMALALRWETRLPFLAYRYLPFFPQIAEACYRWVAAHREGLSSIDRALTGLVGVTPTYSTSSWLFLRGMALAYLIAFSSCALQVQGLIGENGIIPAQTFLSQVFQTIGVSGLVQLPTLFWLDSSDTSLLVGCLIGAVLSLLAMMGLGGATVFFLLWLLYLSLVNVGGAFFSFQWDNLLLEAGLLTVFLAPWNFKFYKARELNPSLLARWLILFLLFRLMISSGLVKIFSGDPTWANLTALQFHYETQPLPTFLAYFMHQLPAGFHTFSTLSMFGIELFLPFLIFAQRRLKLIAALAFISLQVLIALTGNYCFFNLLTILLCLLLIDDATWHQLTFKKFTIKSQATSAWRLPSWSLLPVAIVSILFYSLTVSELFFKKTVWPQFVYQSFNYLAPFRSLNNYGLFAVMTTTRSEIVVEGSDDGSLWLEYIFKWKPGNVKEAPRFVAPHQPRLDWQMWFASLGTYQQNPWFLSFCEQLLRNNSHVISLLEHNPYPDHPPRFIRAVKYTYRFTKYDDLKKNGQWWTATAEGIYLPSISLKNQ